MTDQPLPTSQHAVSDEEKEFYYQVGNAITDWAQVDGRLFSICVSVLKASVQHVAIIYYRTNTLGARLTLVDELLRTVLPKKDHPDGGHDHPITAEWKRLYTDIDSALNTRNQLAHSPVSQVAEIDHRPDGTFGITDVSWTSYRSNAEQSRGRSGDKKELRTEDVKSHVQLVSDLWTRVRAFEIKLASLLAR
jgi:hypothetical protein